MTTSPATTSTYVRHPRGFVGLDSVIYGVDDLSTALTYYQDFGLEVLERGETGATLATQEGSTVILRDQHDASLPEAREDRPTVREMIWGLETQDDLDALVADLSRDLPITRDAGGTVHTVDPAGYGLGFRVSRTTPVTLAPVSLNTVGDALRRNARATFYERARPAHMGHIVMYAPNFDEMYAFYADRLGFWTSDYLDPVGVFLRCTSDHHNLFLVRHHRTGFNHLSFGVHNIDEIMGGFRMLSAQGWEPVWGLGRHFVGSNMFYYFRNPAGGFTEYYADIDCIANPDLWEPGHFHVDEMENLYEWGGPIPDTFIT